jgi:hypothetical protein
MLKLPTHLASMIYSLNKSYLYLEGAKMLPMENTATFTGACANEIIPNG